MSVGAKNDTESVVALWRYPVKSMMGEELNASVVGNRGLLGDRVYAIVDPETGKVASAKHPKKWPHLFDCRAALVEPPGSSEDLPPVRVTLPDGRITRSDDADFNEAVSAMLGRSGKLEKAVPEQPVLEEYWPDIEGLALRETVTDEEMPKGTFFDLGTVHLLTTATLDRLRELYPDGRFEVRRFRPNIVVQTPAGDRSFVESDWVDRTLAIGDEVRLKVTGPCPRCVMTMLPQGDLPRDPGILRAAAQHNEANVGVYAEVKKGGSVRRGDGVRVE
jgi:MOSC domain-containing protein